MRKLTFTRGSLLLFTALVACAAVFTFHYGSYGWGACHPPRVLATAADREEAKRALPTLEEIAFQAPDGVTLRGWFVPPKSGAVVILVHGLGGNRAMLLPDAEIMARAGYGVLLPDSRASGESGGTAATWGTLEALDVAAAIRFVRARSGVTRVALLGFSAGSNAVTRAAATDASIAAVVLYPTWPSLRAEVTHKMRKGGPLAALATLSAFRLSGCNVDDVNAAEDMKRIAPRPVLFVSGSEDADTPPAIMDDMLALSSPPKELWRVPGVGHGGYAEAEPAEFEHHVVGFLDRYLGR
jgi:pimeloyl-ACP methyl ester carboxylesterase